MKPTLVLLPFVLAAPVYCAENSSLVDLLPSDTQIVFGIRVRAVVESELARNLTAELKGQAADWEKVIAMAGFDPLHDIDELIVASNGSGPKAPTLVVARGTFDVAKLAPSGENYHGVPLVTSNNLKAEGVYGFLDGSTALAGDPESVKAAIDRRGAPAKLDQALAAKVAEYRNRYEIWAVVNRVDGLAGYMPPSDSPAAALNSIDHLQFGVSVKKGLELAAEVHARSDKDAMQLATTLQFLEAMSKAQQPAGSPGPKFAFNNDRGTLKVSLAISEEDLKKAIDQQRKAGNMLGIQPGQTHPAQTEPAHPVQTQPLQPAPAQPRPVTAVATGQPSGAAPTAPRQEVPKPAPPKPATAGTAPDNGGTNVFTLPGHP